MAKTRVKTIDDSKPEEPKKEATKKAVKKDSLVEELNKSLGIVEETKEAKAEEKATEDTKKQAVSDKKASLDTAVDKTKSKKEAQSKPKAKVKPRSKKYQAVAQLVNQETQYPLEEAVDLAKKVSYSKYDGTFEVHINTKIKNLRGSVSLPYASGKKAKILAFGKGAEDSGADMVGDDQTLKDISEGKINFDVLVTTPEWMPKLAPLAKTLGPKGLMPNPKNNTISDDLKKAVSEFQSGRLEYKTESNSKVIHLTLGKISQPSEELSQNVKVLLSSIGKSKISKVVLSPTLGPGVKLELASI